MPTLFFPWKPNARGEPRPEAGAQRTLEGVGSTALFGPGPAGETQCMEKGKPYLAGCPATETASNVAGFRRAKTGGAYFAGYNGSCSTLLQSAACLASKGPRGQGMHLTLRIC